MLVNLKKKIIAYGADGSLIEEKKGEGALDLGDAILYVLREVHEMDHHQTGGDKYNRYLVEKRLSGDDGKLKVEEIDLTESEVKMIKERVGKLYLQSGVVGKLWDLLDGKD